MALWSQEANGIQTRFATKGQSYRQKARQGYDPESKGDANITEEIPRAIPLPTDELTQRPPYRRTPTATYATISHSQITDTA